MGYLGRKQRQQLNETVGAIGDSGGSVSLGEATMDSGADLARGLEAAMGSDMTAEQAQNIIDRLESTRNTIEVFAECRRNPSCKPKPKYSTCDVSIDWGGAFNRELEVSELVEVGTKKRQANGVSIRPAYSIGGVRMIV